LNTFAEQGCCVMGQSLATAKLLGCLHRSSDGPDRPPRAGPVTEPASGWKFQLWEAATGKKPFGPAVGEHEKTLQSLPLSPDGQGCPDSGSKDGTARLWSRRRARDPRPLPETRQTPGKIVTTTKLFGPMARAPYSSEPLERADLKAGASLRGGSSGGGFGLWIRGQHPALSWNSGRGPVVRVAREKPGRERYDRLQTTRRPTRESKRPLGTFSAG